MHCLVVGMTLRMLLGLFPESPDSVSMSVLRWLVCSIVWTSKFSADERGFLLSHGLRCGAAERTVNKLLNGEASMESEVLDGSSVKSKR